MKPSDPITLSFRKLAVWATRALFAVIFAALLGGLPVYIHQEIRDLRQMEQELSEIKTLNQRLFIDLEDSAVRLEALRSPRGLRRILRERGFAPPGSVVFQIEKHVSANHIEQ